MQNPNLIVAAIDFGTTFSGYAFSFRYEYQADPLRVHSSTWTSGSSTMSLKTSSTVLFRPDKRFESFGFDAEDRYSDLALDNEHKSWFYFRRFKMMLYNSKVSLMGVFYFIVTCFHFYPHRQYRHHHQQQHYS